MRVYQRKIINAVRSIKRSIKNWDGGDVIGVCFACLWLIAVFVYVFSFSVKLGATLFVFVFLFGCFFYKKV